MGALDLPIPTVLAQLGPLLTQVVAGAVVGWAAERAASRFGLARSAVAGLTTTLLVWAVVAGRLGAVAPHWRMAVAHPLDLLRVNAGLSFLAGSLGAVAALGVAVRRSGTGLWPLVDLYGSVLPLGFAAYGLGCLVRDDCYGRVAPAPFGIVFAGFETPRYPVELYAAALALLAYGAVQWLCARRPPAGVVALASVALLAGSAALLSPLRLDAGGGLTTGDLVRALAVLGLAVTALAAKLWAWRSAGHAGRWGLGARLERFGTG